MSEALHRSQSRIAVVAAVALLIAQLGAMAHAYSHGSAADTAASRQLSSSSHGAAGVKDFCNDCYGFAPLLSAAGAPAPLPALSPRGSSFERGDLYRSRIGTHTHLAFRSRAPPAAL